MTPSPELETTQDQSLGMEHSPTASDLKNLETEQPSAQASLDEVSVQDLEPQPTHLEFESDQVVDSESSEKVSTKILETEPLKSISNASSFQSQQNSQHKNNNRFNKVRNNMIEKFQEYQDKAGERVRNFIEKFLENLLGLISSLLTMLEQLSQPRNEKVLEENEENDQLIDDVEMSFFDHLEELRQRIFYALIAIVLCVMGCFFVSKQIVELLEVPAQGVKFIQLSVGEYFFVSLKTAGYSGILLASPFILYQIIQFVLPGLTRRERRLLAPIVLGSGVLFLVGLGFAYVALIPTALQFFISYGADVVESLYSIDKYFEFVLLLMFFTGLLFQVPVVQMLLALLGIVSSDQMLSGWRYVITGSVVIGAIVTPSVDPFTQCLLAGAVLGLYFGGVGFVKLLGR
jgi:sec-independent protein translocase protein TatC